MNKKIDVNYMTDVLYPLLRIALPLMLTGTLKTSIFFIQTMFLARLGPHVLGAGALVFFLFSTVSMMLFGTLAATSILISYKQGAHDYLGISLVLRDALLLACLLAIPAFVLFWNVSEIFLILGQHPEIVQLAYFYLHALAWGILPSLIMTVLFEVMIGLRRMRTIMAFNLLFACLSIFFCYVLIFGKFGFPAFNIAGVGWGMTISYWLMVIILFIYFGLNQHYRKYFINIFTKTKFSYLRELIHIGIPMGAMYSLEIAFFFVLTLLMGAISSQLLAANQVVLQFAGLLMPIAAYIAQAITIQMSYFLGAEQFSLAKSVNYSGILISIGIMGFIAIGYWFFPKTLISLDFNISHPKNVIIIHEVEKLFIIAGIFQMIEAIRICLFGALRALRDTKFTLLISFLNFWCIALPIGYLLAIQFHLNGIGFWLGMVVGASFGVITLSLRLRSKLKWKCIN